MLIDSGILKKKVTRKSQDTVSSLDEQYLYWAMVVKSIVDWKYHHPHNTIEYLMCHSFRVIFRNIMYCVGKYIICYL
jgi:hypothetical protein